MLFVLTTVQHVSGIVGRKSMIKRIAMAAVIAGMKGIKTMPDVFELLGNMEYWYGPKDTNQSPKSAYHDEAAKIADLVVAKQKAYGRAYQRAGKVLEIMYPVGVRPDQYQDMLGVVRVLDKLFRIATDKNAMGESPWGDITGYGLLGVVGDKGDT